MTTMLFYQHAVPLNRQQHRDLRILQREHPFGFAAKTNSVLLAGIEIPVAAHDYPIVFVGQEGGPYTLGALVGLRDSENLCVTPEGGWLPGQYIPAFVRRYPFVLAEAGDSDPLTVYVDESYDGISMTEGSPLFDEAGQETEFMKGVTEFLVRFHAEMKRTAAFASRLSGLGLLEPKTVSVDRQGARQTLQGLWVVNEDKLQALPDEVILELFRNGYLGWIHLHLASLSNIARLAERLGEGLAVAS